MIGYIALGTNIEPREDYINKALMTLSKSDRINISNESSIYETTPVGLADQADFLNMVVEIHTSLSPVELLDVCQSIEKELGRKRTIRNGPRTIDLDILVYNQEYRETEHLTLPHPRMHKRAFVLVPLKEIAPNLTIAGQHAHVKDLLEDLSASEKKGVSKWTPKKPADE